MNIHSSPVVMMHPVGQPNAVVSATGAAGGAGDKTSIEETNARLSGMVPPAVGIDAENDDTGEGSETRTGNNAESNAGGDAKNGQILDLSEQEQKLVEELKARDVEVRTHEQAHVAAGGQYVRGGPNYDLQIGPDGRAYAVGGEVDIDTSEVPGDPEQTAEKARTIQRAALAPAEPSSQDYRVAATAKAMEIVAQREIAEQREARLKQESGEEGAVQDGQGDTRSIRAEPLSEKPGAAAQQTSSNLTEQDASSPPGIQVISSMSEITQRVRSELERHMLSPFTIEARPEFDFVV